MPDERMCSRERFRRQTILITLRAGRKPAEIVNLLKLPKATVYRIAKQVSLAGDNEVTCERKRHERDRPKRTPQVIEGIERRLQQDHHASFRKLSAEFNLSRASVSQVVHDDLARHTYRPKVRQMLSEANKQSRVSRCQKLLSSLKKECAGAIRFFSDEKIFTVDAKFNRQNHRCHVHDKENCCIVRKTKFPANVHVLSVVSSEGDKMPPHFFAKGETVNQTVYLNVLQTVVKPWMVKVSAGRPYVFQQDGAPAHTSKAVQDWLASNVHHFWPKDFWPPNSPDLNPLDYFVWSVVEADSNKTHHSNVESLRLAVRMAFRNLSKVSLKNACNRFRSRLEAVIASGGGYIE